MIGDFEFHHRHPIEDNADFEASISEFRRGNDQALVMHCDFHRFTPSVFRDFLKRWAILRSTLTAPLFAYGREDDAKWARFVSLLGFQQISTFHDTAGRCRRIYLSLPENAHRDRQDQQHEHV